MGNRIPHRLSPIGLLDRYTLWCLRLPRAKGLAASMLPLIALIVCLAVGAILPAVLGG